MSTKLIERDWNILLGRIRDGKCTPILGEDIYAETTPAYMKLAKKWANENSFPLTGMEEDLVRVAQYISVFGSDKMYPKEELVKEVKSLKPPDYSMQDEAHAVLASLPLPIYITTNYNNYMEKALESKHKSPKRELCRWNDEIRHFGSVFSEKSDYEPSVSNPFVFHLNGLDTAPESLVLTEDDYLEFLRNISRDEDIIPMRIWEAITGTSLLILGYTPNDLSLKTLFTGLIKAKPRGLARLSVTVQLPPVSEDPDDPKQKNLQQYINDYFLVSGIKAYWGTTQEFIAELRQRWSDYEHANN